MAKVMKKAQDGDTLRTGQYKRIGRIAEKNPERAGRVAERMTTRAGRVERGKDIAGDSDRGGRSARNWALQSLTESRMEAKESSKKPILDDKILKKGENPYKTDKNTTLPTVTVTSSLKKKMKNGGATAKDGKWIQKAINPKHKGYCTPMTKATCTPKRKALAMTLKKMGRARKGK